MHDLKAVRIATLIAPPIGMILLWRSREIPLKRKLLGTLGIILFSLLYSAGILAILIYFFGLELEWRGGFPPVPTWNKTLPNFAAVEVDRARKKSSAKTSSVSAKTTSSYWTDFRGPKRDGHYDEKPILTNWPANGLRELWRQPVGGGYASFVIAEGRAFTIEQRRDGEVIAAYDIENGAEIWTNNYPAHFDESMGGDGPRATPTYHQGKIFSLGAMGDLRCLEASSGKLIWKRDITADAHAPILTYGMASSPLIVDDKVIVQAGGKNYSVAAYDKESGQPLWHSLDDEAAYSSPILVELAGEQQLLIVTKHRAVGLNPKNGKLLWSFPWVVKLQNRNIAQPVLLGTNRFFRSAGYGTGCATVEIAKVGDELTARVVWQNKNLKNKFSSSVFFDGFLYGLDEDILVCLDAKTGERKWKDGRYGYGQVLLASGHLVILSGDGQLALVKATPEKHVERARFQAIRGKTWNHPAISDGKIFVRNAVEMACFEISR
ncbi:MAG: PQQ-binding-like beta-propeller repeat protein [Verrucomicrobiota bacterium]